MLAAFANGVAVPNQSQSHHPPFGAHSHAIPTSEDDHVGSADGWEHAQDAVGPDAYNIVDQMVEGGHGGEVDDVSSSCTYEDPELIDLTVEWNIIARDDI